MSARLVLKGPEKNDAPLAREAASSNLEVHLFFIPCEMGCDRDCDVSERCPFQTRITTNRTRFLLKLQVPH